ncbi:hypothetical protein SEVIR_9G249300v4 [Setaria viridis]|uniref:VWFA domain-containing protein n=1 Tax=Setaria viridis TaxID=4556 RepID=A0A4V6D1B4_SETVI|nr:hypothetical protein SEVIR_9G249300v2 [Setaria viridis]
MPDIKLPHFAAAPPPPVVVFQDDDPLEPRPAAGGAQAAPAANGGLVLKVQCEFPALGRGASWDKFAVLVDAKAPADVARAPLDLVTVLDVSGSMNGQKLELVKRAMCFVVDQLGPADRLSVVTFSDAAWRITHLARMSAAGKAAAKLAVERLVVVGGTNIGQGLLVGTQVLLGRRHRNAVASMILLSDGQDTCLPPAIAQPNGGVAKSYASLVPPSFASAGSRPGPIHTFGFGADHDAAAMHAIAEATGGTFSFVQDQAAIQDSFARCVGGLLSVAVQETRVAVTCLHRGVRVQDVKSGSYESNVAADGRAATIDAGELYDDERRRFLVLVYVPRARATEEVTRLVKVSCTYRDAATGQTAHAAAPAAVIQRPLELEHMPPPSIEVERERVRLAAAEGIAAARAAADGGQHAGAARILDARLKEVERSAPGAAGDDPTCEAIKEELRDLSARVGDRREYQQTGRACLLAGMSSHAQQRASGVELQGSAGKAAATATTRAYLTPKMEEMVDLSRESSRKRGSSQRPGGRSEQVIKQVKQDLSENF